MGKESGHTGWRTGFATSQSHEKALYLAPESPCLYKGVDLFHHSDVLIVSIKQQKWAPAGYAALWVG